MSSTPQLGDPPRVDYLATTIHHAQQFYKFKANDLTYSQLQRIERLIRDLKDLEYDVRKANDYLYTSGKEGSCTVCEMSGVSSKSEK